MTSYTLSEASKAAGRSKSTILRSIRAGRISASRDELTGGWNIDAAELHRVYGGPPLSNGEMVRDAPDDAPGNAASNAVLQAKLDAAETRLADAHASIADLRRRLDVADEERRRLTMVLADTRATPPRRAWWPWARRA